MAKCDLNPLILFFKKIIEWEIKIAHKPKTIKNLFPNEANAIASCMFKLWKPTKKEELRKTPENVKKKS